MSAVTGPCYDELELAVLQSHLDLYRYMHECSTLISFSIVHRGEQEKACLRLQARGLMETASYDGLILHEAIDDDPKHPQYLTAMSQPHEIWSIPETSERKIIFVSEEVLSGVIGTLTDKGKTELVRLFKASILKKNNE